MDSIEFSMMFDRLERLQSTVEALVKRQAIKEWYTTEEVAQIVEKAEFTVREWCRQGRVHAEKKGSGRGKYQSWVISNDELQRLQREGILPVKR